MTAPDPGEGVAEPAPAGSGPPRSGRLARARGGNWPCDDDVCTRPAQSASPIRGRAGGRAAGGESIVPCRSRGRRRARPAYTRPVDGFDQGEDGGGARVGPERSVPKQVITDQRTDLAAEQEEARARRRDARYGRCGSVQFRPQSAEPQAAARREGWRPGICFESTVRARRIVVTPTGKGGPLERGASLRRRRLPGCILGQDKRRSQCTAGLRRPRGHLTRSRSRRGAAGLFGRATSTGHARPCRPSR